MSYVRLLLILITLIPTSGWSQEDSSPSADDSYQSDDYVLQPLDFLQIKVYQEPDMARDVRISRESMVSLPLIGQVNLKGLTIRAAEEQITRLYDKDYLVNPQINLVVLEYARRTVNVLGQVSSPGEIEFPREEGLTLMDAISRAGGFTRLAEKRKIKLTRKLDDGTTKNYTINADDLIDGASTEVWKLRTDDLIYVPERFL